MLLGSDQIRKTKESIRDYVPSALAAVDKKILDDLHYNSVPQELLCGERLDLSQWSLVVTDKCLDNIRATHQKSSAHSEKSCSFSSKLTFLNLSGAEKITDTGLQSLVSCSSDLQSLYLENVYSITGAGLKAITRQCQGLRLISLSGCMGISPEGFGILGQNCRELVTLKLSGCRQVSTWAFMKIFESCSQLITLDISFCSLVTDQEIKLLSQKCPGLRYINLRECTHISDIGLCSLSQNCQNLSEIVLRRSDLPFRISDVALLQMGQGCEGLVSVNLRGCEMISDTGLSWLVSGTKELRHIDLSNCCKVTNSGIRFISEGCNKLKSIELLNLNRVSNVGVRCLAAGCHTLEEINASGMIMLSDGVDRSFGLEGLQALGKSKCATVMKRLVLHGCCLLSTNSLNSISYLCNLEILDLSGCNKLTLEGINWIGKACLKLSNVSLATCGECVTNAMVESLVVHLKFLTSANFSFCYKLGEGGLKALSKCEKLQSLNLTGCQGVDDQSIFHLCEGRFSPGLRDLFLAGCNKVNDIALSWITDGLKQGPDCFVSLETLSLKGTRVTHDALKGIRDRYPFSILKVNDSYRGFWPLPRSSDRKLIKDYYKRSHSAAKIQACVRTYKEKDTLKHAREEYCKKRVAVWAGARFRAGKARGYFIELKKLKLKCNADCLRIQCVFRMHVAKEKAKAVRERERALLAPIASNNIQRLWRGVLGRRIVKTIKLKELGRAQCRLNAIRRIQAWLRIMCAKRILLQLKYAWVVNERHRLKACIKIQSTWRRHCGRQSMMKLKLQFEEQQKLRLTSVARIKTQLLSHLFRKAIERRIKRTQLRLRGAVLIQRWFRYENDRAWHKQLVERLSIELKLNSSSLIQRNVRRRLAYSKLVILKQQNQKRNTVRQEKSLIICRWARLWLAKHRMKQRRDAYEEEIRRMLILRVWAATKISSVWRGKLGRDLAKSYRIIRSQRWKELWSESEQMKFYYNQDTGETRWEKPQCLLELEPKPKCCNCNNTRAELECADCDEFFCTNCWEFIHFGGRRAHHSFRYIYDFYGRRKDYDREPWQRKLEIS